MASNPHIITLEEGWDNQIKKKVVLLMQPRTLSARQLAWMTVLTVFNSLPVSARTGILFPCFNDGSVKNRIRVDVENMYCFFPKHAASIQGSDFHMIRALDLLWPVARRPPAERKTLLVVTSP